MSSPDVPAGGDLAEALAVVREHVAGPDPERDAAAVDDGLVQALMDTAVRAYFAKTEGGQRLSPFPDAAPPSATEVLTAATAMLRAVDVEAFELGMWMSRKAVRADLDAEG